MTCQETNKDKKRSGIILNILVVILIIVGVLGIIIHLKQDDIKVSIVSSMVGTPLGNGYEVGETEDEGLEPVYDVENTENMTLEGVLSTSTTVSNAKSKGRIYVPSVGIDLKVYEGLNNEHLHLGAAEHFPRSKVSVGEYGNYTLAAHSSTWHPNFLFTPLTRVSAGDLIHITDRDNVYTYRVLFKENYHRDNGSPLVDTPDRKVVTLYTCLSDGSRNPEIRVVVQGELIGVQTLEEANLPSN